MMTETARLILREMTENDYPALYDVLSDRESMRFYPYSFDSDRVHAWIAKNRERYRIFGFGLWAVVLKGEERVIGDCGLTMQTVNGVIRPEIGYHIHRAYQRQGYAKEAARKCLDWTFRNTPFRTVCSYMKADNAPSAATARSIGMRPAESYFNAEGEMTAVYEITMGEWERYRPRN